MVRTSTKIVAIVMAVLVPCSFLSAEVHGAMLYASNSVIVNGITIQKTSAILPGDQVSVPQGSAATLTLTGTSILVPALGKVTFNGTSVSLQPQTAVSISTTVGTAAEISDFKISPAQRGQAHYQVARFNGHVYVAAKQGSVLIASAAGSRLVAEGSTATITDPEPQQPSAVPATTGVGAAHMPTWVAVLIGVAVAGVGAGVAIATTGTPASPSVP